jgi:hypothetical protein
LAGARVRADCGAGTGAGAGTVVLEPTLATSVCGFTGAGTDTVSSMMV